MLVTTADVTGCNVTVVIATSSFALFLDESREWTAFVEVRIDHLDHATTTGRCRF
jgi:hypothetical protein